MNKELLISIKPEHLVNILNGKKTRELRKRVPKDYKGWVYVYVVKPYPLLNYIDGDYKLMDRKNHIIFHDIGMYEFYNDDIHLNGKVIARFWFDEYDIYDYEDVSFPEGYEDYDGTFVDTTKYVNGYYVLNTELEKLCLSYEEFETYGNGKTLYAWHIKDLEIFDKPKDLSEFSVERAPKSYQFVYVKGTENE